MDIILRPKSSDLSKHLICKLCNGFLIDATALPECSHEFCKSCIVKHCVKFGSRGMSGAVFCPVLNCGAEIHKTRPFSKIKNDATLQTLIYKLFPEVYKDEMKRRKVFYANPLGPIPSYSGWFNPDVNRAATNEDLGVPQNPEWLPLDIPEHLVVSLRYCSPSDLREMSEELQAKDALAKETGNQTQYRESNTTVEDLKLFLSNKFHMRNKEMVVLIHTNIILNKEHTLGDLLRYYGVKETDLLIDYLFIDPRAYADEISREAAIIRLMRAKPLLPIANLPFLAPPLVLDEATESAPVIGVAGHERPSPLRSPKTALALPKTVGSDNILDRMRATIEAATAKELRMEAVSRIDGMIGSSQLSSSGKLRIGKKAKAGLSSTGSSSVKEVLNKKLSGRQSSKSPTKLILSPPMPPPITVGNPKLRQILSSYVEPNDLTEQEQVALVQRMRNGTMSKDTFHTLKNTMADSTSISMDGTVPMASPVYANLERLMPARLSGDALNPEHDAVSPRIIKRRRRSKPISSIVEAGSSPTMAPKVVKRRRSRSGADGKWRPTSFYEKHGSDHTYALDPDLEPLPQSYVNSDVQGCESRTGGTLADETSSTVQSLGTVVSNGSQQFVVFRSVMPSSPTGLSTFASQKKVSPGDSGSNGQQVGTPGSPTDGSSSGNCSKRKTPETSSGSVTQKNERHIPLSPRLIAPKPDIMNMNQFIRQQTMFAASPTRQQFMEKNRDDLSIRQVHSEGTQAVVTQVTMPMDCLVKILQCGNSE